MTIKHTAGGTRYEQHGEALDFAEMRIRTILNPEQPHGKCPFGETDCTDPTHAKLWEIQQRA